MIIVHTIAECGCYMELLFPLPAPGETLWPELYGWLKCAHSGDEDQILTYGYVGVDTASGAVVYKELSRSTRQ